MSDRGLRVGCRALVRILLILPGWDLEKQEENEGIIGKEVNEPGDQGR